jgi:sortase A
MKIHIDCRSPSTVASLLRWVERFLLLVGALALGFCALVYFEARVYQDFEARQLEKMQPRREASGGISAGKVAPMPRAVPDGAAFSTIEIPRLSLSVVVAEGVKPATLRHAVGHIPGTALPGKTGNVGIAGHRDTFFRPLAEVRPDDLITLHEDGVTYKYAVESVRIVDPSDVQVLDPSTKPVLTLVTCYPFYFVGPAPQRYIVRARQVAVEPDMSAQNMPVGR